MSPILGIIASRKVILAPPSTNLIMWYDANDATTITNSSGKCSAITNKGPTGFTLSQATSANQPTIVANAQNGKTALRFSGCSLSNSNNSPMVGATAVSIFAAAKYTGGAADYKVAFGSNTSNNGAFPLTYMLTTGANYYETGSGGNPLTSSSTYTNTGNIQMVKQGSSSREQSTYINGVSTDNQTGGNSPALNIVSGNQLNTLGLGGGNWDFYETLWYNAVLSGGDTTTVIDYLKAKWAI
jgi:hypothetical protein